MGGTGLGRGEGDGPGVTDWQILFLIIGVGSLGLLVLGLLGDAYDERERRDAWRRHHRD